MKKQIILGMASLMFAGMLSTGTVSATGASPTDGTTVPVSYDNRNSLVDPDNPDLPAWSVSIPTAVAFGKGVNGNSKPVGVELVPLNGSTLASLTQSGLNVDVKAKSNNGLELLEEGGEAGKGLKYTVTYGANTLDDTTGTTETTIATLTGAAPTAAGTAELTGTTKPTKLAVYTDTLTYSIEKKVIINN